VKTLTVVAWVVDALIIVYFLQTLAGNSSEWSGASTLIFLIALLLASVTVSALLWRRAQTRRSRLLALIVAGAVPVVGCLLFLGVGLIALVAGGSWN
jgi:hypothetical protein